MSRLQGLVGLLELDLPVLSQHRALKFAHWYELVAQRWKACANVGLFANPTSAINPAIPRRKVANPMGCGAFLLRIGQLQHLEQRSVRHEQDTWLQVAAKNECATSDRCHD
ncbi:hypothetical protein AB4Z46_10170 [Variovorax sp. M-6]